MKNSINNKGYVFRTTAYCKSKLTERNFVILHNQRLSDRGIKKTIKDELKKEYGRIIFRLKIFIHDKNQVNPNGGMWHE